MFDQAIPARYLAPKWQAYVTPDDKAFVFSNGLKVRSMWEFKQALLIVPEDVINHHIREDSNDVAVWVGSVIGDSELAQELGGQKHRWGMIVSLERQMMRTLKLPDYVAQRWLRQSESPFTFASGEEVRSLEELAETLKGISDDVVSFHQERVPNDVAVWVGDVVGNYELAQLLEEASGRWQMQRFVEDHVAMLKEAC